MLRYLSALAVCLSVSTLALGSTTDKGLQASFDAVKNGKFDSAIQTTTKSLDDNHLSKADRAGLLALRAYALLLKDEPKAAKRDLQVAIKIAPDTGVQQSVVIIATQAYLLRAHDYDTKQKWELSIANYSEALKYNPNSEIAYIGRAEAHTANTEFDEAISDYDHAIRINGSSSDTYVDRGAARESKVDFEGAIADYSEAIKLNSKNDTAFGYRGRGYAIAGNYSAARRDLERALALRPTDRSSLLWLHLVHMRVGENDEPWLRKQAATLKLEHWPGPVISYFLGTKSADELLQIALHSPETARGHQRCDGWFYLGEEALARKKILRARYLFQKTVGRCNATDYEWNSARVELRRMTE